MTNSAHDNIEIHGDADNLKEYKDQLSRAKIRPNKLYDVLLLIQQMHKAKDDGPAQLAESVYKFEYRGKNIALQFNIRQLVEKGWLDNFPETLSDHGCSKVDSDILTALQSQASLEQLEKKNIQLLFKHGSESETLDDTRYQKLRVDQLLRKMDLYGIGRPSTFGSTFKAMREGGYLIIDENSGEVCMTEEAFRAYTLLQEKLPDLCGADFSTWLYILQRDLEEGQKEVSDVLSSVCDRVLDSNLTDIAKSRLWENIDEFYTNKTESDSAKNTSVRISLHDSNLAEVSLQSDEELVD